MGTLFCCSCWRLYRAGQSSFAAMSSAASRICESAARSCARNPHAEASWSVRACATWCAYCLPVPQHCVIQCRKGPAHRGSGEHPGSSSDPCRQCRLKTQALLLRYACWATTQQHGQRCHQQQSHSGQQGRKLCLQGHPCKVDTHLQHPGEHAFASEEHRAAGGRSCGGVKGTCKRLFLPHLAITGGRSAPASAHSTRQQAVRETACRTSQSGVTCLLVRPGRACFPNREICTHLLRCPS